MLTRSPLFPIAEGRNGNSGNTGQQPRRAPWLPFPPVNLFQKLRACLRFIRFGNCAVAAATSLAGSWAAGETLQRDKPYLLALSAFLIAAFGNGYNDVCDLPADRVNRPDRVLPRGDISQILALRIAGWCLILGLMAGFC